MKPEKEEFPYFEFLRVKESGDKARIKELADLALENDSLYDALNGYLLLGDEICIRKAVNKIAEHGGEGLIDVTLRRVVPHDLNILIFMMQF